MNWIRVSYHADILTYRLYNIGAYSYSVQDYHCPSKDVGPVLGVDQIVKLIYPV
jgi:hypothetical protein